MTTDVSAENYRGMKREIPAKGEVPTQEIITLVKSQNWHTHRSYGTWTVFKLKIPCKC